MSGLLSKPKAPTPVPTPDIAGADRRAADERRRRPGVSRASTYLGTGSSGEQGGGFRVSRLFGQG